jgi:hypothetical protein
MVTRHEFLARLHHFLNPKLYVETGVHTGGSLNLASCKAIGIDPNPLVHNLRMNQTVVKMTSDDYFAANPELPGPIDFGFIDGLHHYEVAWRDFLNMEQRASSYGVIVFDDVLPTTQEMASRDMTLGDWTGDVWKCFYILMNTRADLSFTLVDTFPTGTLVVWDLDPSSAFRSDIIPNPIWQDGDTVPDEILFRTTAVSADTVMEMLREWRG